MGKKRLGRTSFRNKQAQVTVFIILGLLLLFVFLFTIKLAGDVKKSDLEAEKEKVVSKTFKKEALRIYVEDCLNDALEQGLILLGKQGRIWKGQPGGTKPFLEGETGVTFTAGDRIYYGISNEKYLQHQNAYPCNNESFSPQFCSYRYPNTTIGFGSLDLKTSTIKNDLRQYLTNRTIFCVKNFTESEISQEADIIETKIKTKLDIANDGINVEVEYPLKLSVGKEEFFHLSQFDFFYPTKFRWLLEAAVSRPLFYDWKFVEFNYTKETLEQSHFNYSSTSSSCVDNVCQGSLLFDKYKSLAIEMTNLSLPNGDTIFIFKSPKILNLPEDYEFRIARQNRPPALDYVNRSSCIVKDDPGTDEDESENSYDYLIILGHDDYGNVDIKLNAWDADEDEIVEYVFENPSWDPTEPPQIKQELYFPEDYVETYFTSEIVTLTAKATDEHGLSDWQEVRILVDTPLTAGLKIWYPYEIEDAAGVIPYSEFIVDTGTLVSEEDPIFVNVTYPSLSVIGNPPKVELSYSENLPFDITLPEENYPPDKDVCFNFPYTNPFCTPDSLFSGYEDLNNWPKEGPPLTFPLTSGTLKLSASNDYCSNNVEAPAKKIDFKVVQCIPHVNPTHPFPYMPTDTEELYKLYDCTDENDISTCQKDDDFILFLASHVCCNPDTWEYYTAEEQQTCYVSPDLELGCFGGLELETKGAILEERKLKVYCSGERGNICNGEQNYDYEYPDQETKCGENKHPTCDVETDCELKNPYYYETGANGFWCHGNNGCENICESEIVSAANLGFDLVSTSPEQIACGCSENEGICLDLKTNKKGTCEGNICKLPDGTG